MKYIKKKKQKQMFGKMFIIFLLPIYFNPSQDSRTDSQVKFNITIAYKTPILLWHK